MTNHDVNSSTITSSGANLKPVTIIPPTPTLTLIYGPATQLWGARVYLGNIPVPIDRLSRTFENTEIADPDASRVHAQVQKSMNGFSITDLGSKNGTFVNGKRIKNSTVALSYGDIIQVGSTLLLFHKSQNPPPTDHAIPGLDGHGDAIRNVRSSLAKMAGHQTSILILGESGTGKEVVAKAIAEFGRPSKPFVAFNVSAVPATLAESMLFGHLKGAFTDAKEARAGVFMAANGGTLFLDEIGDLAPETQVKLLRVLEERAVVPVGATRPIPFDVRIVSATNRDLLAGVKSGRFRGDLYARLAGMVLPLPSLRERIEDLPLLAHCFANGRRFSAQAITRLMTHSWPFNIRELRSVVEQAAAESPGLDFLELSPAIIHRLDEHASILEPRTQSPDVTARQTLDTETVAKILAEHGGNMSQAAKAAGKDRGQFYRIIKRLGLDPDSFR